MWETSFSTQNMWKDDKNGNLHDMTFSVFRVEQEHKIFIYDSLFIKRIIRIVSKMYQTSRGVSLQ